MRRRSFSSRSSNSLKSFSVTRGAPSGLESWGRGVFVGVVGFGVIALGAGRCVVRATDCGGSMPIGRTSSGAREAPFLGPDFRAGDLGADFERSAVVPGGASFTRVGPVGTGFATGA